jgi:hypothetical protein
MTPCDLGELRLAVLNPGGRDPEQDFSEGSGAPVGKLHAPVNFHAYAACTAGSFFRDAKRALAHDAPVLLLLRGDFKASLRALIELKKHKRTVAVSLKETGRHQIAEQLADANKLELFRRAVRGADGCIASTLEAVEVYRAFRSNADPETVEFIPTPYPVEDNSWNFSRPLSERSGIFVGTREWDVPSRNHLGALLLARRLGEETAEPATVFNLDRRKGERRLRELSFPREKIRILQRRLPYIEYLQEVAKHKIVLQLDTSCVPGQIAGDALLCRVPCVGGNGAVERLVFPSTCCVGRETRDLEEVAKRLLEDAGFYDEIVRQSQAAAAKLLSFGAVRKQLEKFFVRIAG